MARGEPRRPFFDDQAPAIPVRAGRTGGGSEKPVAPRRPERYDQPLEIVATLPPLHPGEVLREEFLEPMGLSAGQLAKACGVPRTRIERIAAETMGISGDTALRLGRFFGTHPRFWMNLQVRYELEIAKASLGGQIAEIQPHQAT
jgi:antitoxin HigA-1